MFVLGYVHEIQRGAARRRSRLTSLSSLGMSSRA
jgi:hypothetical protein